MERKAFGCVVAISISGGGAYDEAPRDEAEDIEEGCDVAQNRIILPEVGVGFRGCSSEFGAWMEFGVVALWISTQWGRATSMGRSSRRGLRTLIGVCSYRLRNDLTYTLSPSGCNWLVKDWKF